MKKFIAAAIIIAIAALSWDTQCDHVYVAVEQPELTYNNTFASMTTTEYTTPISGKREGKRLVCVKCFEKRAQVIEYKNTAWVRPKFDNAICPEPPKVWVMDSTGTLIQVLKTCW
jgi:hypothetical protein